MREQLRRFSERLLGQSEPTPRTHPLSDRERAVIQQRDADIRARITAEHEAAVFGRDAVGAVVTTTEQMVLAGVVRAHEI